MAIQEDKHRLVKQLNKASFSTSVVDVQHVLTISTSNDCQLAKGR